MNKLPLLCVRTISGLALSVCLFAAWVDGGASPMTTGTVTLDFISPPMSTEPWQLRIWGRTYSPFEDGQFELNLRSDSNGVLVRQEILWHGSAAAGDTFLVQRSLDPPNPGRYMLAARLVPFLHGTSGSGSTARIAYLLVRPDTVFLAWSSNAENMRSEMEYDLRKRGLEDVDPKLLDSLAPDLAERWRKVKGWKDIGPPPKPKTSPPPKVYDPSRQRIGEGRDTTLIPGWGPPPAKPTPDSVKALFPHRGPNPRREPPPPFLKPEDTEFGRSEEAARLRKLLKHYNDSVRAADSANSVEPD